jgi:uncharacterized protein (TIGR04255 family)
MSKKYKKNYLDNVVLRIDFEEVEDARLKVFLNKLEDIFPYKTKEEGIEESVKIDIKGNKVTNNRKKIPTWIYLDAYKNKKVTVTPGFVAIEYLNRSYRDSKELRDDCCKIINTSITDLSISSVKRLGLRYVNRFDLDAGIKESIKWNDFFSKDLVGSVSFANKMRYPIVRAMSNLHIRSDGCDILVRYGIWNQDFPSENNRKEFILDIDIFSRIALENMGEIANVVKDFNQNAEKIFEKSIGVEIKKILVKK